MNFLISRSTISSDLKKARHDIKKYGLTMKQNLIMEYVSLVMKRIKENLFVITSLQI